MNLRHHRYFTAVAEEMHVLHATQTPHVSQLRLSQSIKALENSPAVRLFWRARGSVRLAESGWQILRRAYVLLEKVDQAISVTRRAGCSEAGKLEIGFTGSMPFTDVLPRILRDFWRPTPIFSCTCVR